MMKRPSKRTLYICIIAGILILVAFGFLVFSKSGGSLKFSMDSNWGKEVVLVEKKGGVDGYILELVSEKNNFKLSEVPTFKFRFQKKRGFLGRVEAGIFNLIRDEYKDIGIKVTVLEADNIRPTVSYLKNGEFLVNFPEGLRQFKPGKHRLRIEIGALLTHSAYLAKSAQASGQKDFLQIAVFEQEFVWGVLAINANKSIYTPRERAYLQMAVLKDDGHTVCNANLKLKIKNQKSKIETVLSTEDGTIQYSGKCGPDNVTDVPDYFAYYQVGEIGTYQMQLINLDNGYEITDSFEVRESVPFDIERIGPTRIYPPASYEMRMIVRVNEDFQGQVIEQVPAGFEIIEANETRISTRNGAKEIVWQVDWKQGETHELKYTFDAPDVSPYLYLLGPLKFYGSPSTSSGRPDFSEIRSWQIAADDAEGDPYLLIVQTGPEKGSSAWWEWIVVNPTSTPITVTEVRIDQGALDWGWTADNSGWPGSGWEDGNADGYFWSGSEEVAAYSAKVFRSKPIAANTNSEATMDWTVNITGYSPNATTSQVLNADKAAMGGLFYNKPNDEAEQTAVDGFYAYLYEDKDGNELLQATQYIFYVNIFETLGEGDLDGTLTIIIPKEFNSVSLKDYTDFSDAEVTAGEYLVTDWTIEGTNTVAIKEDVRHLSFYATTPAAYPDTTKIDWEFDSRFTGTGGKNGTAVYYINEAMVLVRWPKVEQKHYRWRYDDGGE